MFVAKKSLPRRTFLRGAGSMLMGLPLLDAMVPALSAMSTTAANPVRRLGFFYVPNGVCQPSWWPKTAPGAESASLELSPILSPLAKVRDQVTLMKGLAHHQAEGLGDGDAEHTRASSVWLNGVHPKLTEGADVQAGTTVDQLAAKVLCKDTQLQSLELALEPNYMVGNCNDGYSCVYMNTFVWRTPTMPLPMENNPRVVFERLFGLGGSAAERQADMRKNRSILDSVTAEMAGLQRSLGAGDRTIVSEYLDSVREIEQRIDRASKTSANSLPANLDRPIGIPENFEEHAKLMFDLQWLAYRADITRVTTFQMAREFSSRSYPNIGVADGHHSISHHTNDPEKLSKYAKICQYHMELFAYFLDRMQSTPDGDGSLLDHSMFLYGGGISDGNKHDHVNLPALLVGGGAGKLKGGRYLQFPDPTPMSNLFVSLLDKVGVNTDKMGDSTGPLRMPQGLSGV